MAKDIRQLRHDLKRWLNPTRIRDIALKRSAKKIVDAASLEAPVETGFLRRGGFAFLDGRLVYQKEGAIGDGEGRRTRPAVPVPPHKTGISIIFMAPKKAGANAIWFKYIGGVKVFDYALQHTGFIEKVVNPQAIKQVLDETIYELWLSKK